MPEKAEDVAEHEIQSSIPTSILCVPLAKGSEEEVDGSMRGRRSQEPGREANNTLRPRSDRVGSERIRN